MAMTAGSSSNQHSPPSSGSGGETAVNSPRIRKNLPSPWAQVVRGETEVPPISDQPPSPTPPPLQSSPQLDTVPTSPSPADDGLHAVGEGSGRNSGNAASSPSKKPASAWNKQPSMVEALPVMEDAISWPALSEAIRFPPKVQYADPPASANLQVRPAVVNSLKKPVPATSNHVDHSHTQNHAASARQKPTKHGGNGNNTGGNSSSSGGSNISTAFVQNSFSNPSPQVVPSPPPPPPFPILVGPNGYGNFIPSMVDPSVNQPYKGNTFEGRPGFMHQPHAISDHRNSSRRGNIGSRPRSDGPSHRGASHRGGHGGRHDHDRGNFRSNRDVNMPSQRNSHIGGYVRTPPLNAVPFFPPHGVRPFGPGPFPDFYYPGMHMEPYRAGGPFFPSAVPVPVLIPLAEDPSVSILNQINYYFSDDNLVKDKYLKSNMDAEGWVHIGLIANFPRVKSLTTDDKLILQTMKSSTIVEVEGEKLRRRNDWKKWLVPPSVLQVSSETGSPSSSSTHSALAAASLEKVTMEDMPITEPSTDAGLDNI